MDRFREEDEKLGKIGRYACVCGGQGGGKEERLGGFLCWFFSFSLK